jgi:hypothetical protein
MPTRKSSGLMTPSGLLRLVTHAAMGVAMGLAFALFLMLGDRSGSIQHGGPQGVTMLTTMLVLSFGIGATLTGAVFIIMEES